MTLHRAHLPGSPARNGLPLPPRRFYTYQGDGDLRPDLTDADLAPYVVDYQQWLPSFERGNPRPGRAGAK